MNESDGAKAEKQWLTVDEVAEILHCDPQTVRRMLNQKRLVGMRLGSALKAQWRIHPDALEDFRRSGEKG